jgi:phosphate starvation-inducible PhoH-like protein
MATRSGKKKREEFIEYSEEEIVERDKGLIRKIINHDLKVIAKNESQKSLIRSIKNNEITICSGRAGSGKTFISLAYALNLLRSTQNKYTKIYFVKSVTTLKGEELGYLKGDLNEKIEPFMWSFILNVEKLLPNGSIENLMNSEHIRPFPLAFARGVSLDNAIILADEVQNISMDNIRTLMTRIGRNSKMILCGDINQIDLKNKNYSSLENLLKMFSDVEEIGCIEMDVNDNNVRNPLIDKIEEKFTEYAK